ncbi:MAG: dUTP diphosphatase [Marinagarivorans sp.]|nr:dUTP diphosphatase [Marinagarivorans sp.]
MQKQLLKMLEMQDAMNSKVNREWRAQGNAWYRAIWVECAEMLDHYGWKWWKKQHPDMPQVILELVDIWHFGLSDLLQRENHNGNLAELLALELASPIASPAPFRDQLEVFVTQVLTYKQFDLPAFCHLMASASLSFENLYLQYMGKNVLNFFRQDHGYKEGSYHKIWHGREDNEHLVEVLTLLEVSSSTFQSDVYAALEARYPKD